MRFTRSIRWRFQGWLAFLLASILIGFGITAYQLNRTNRLNQIDEELVRRVSALSGDLRGRVPFGPPGRGRGPGGRENAHFGEPGPVPGREERFPRPERPMRSLDNKPLGPPENRMESRRITLSLRTLALFDDLETEGFYYAIWSRSGALLKSSTNAPSSLVMPINSGTDTLTRTRSWGEFREAYHFTGIGECVLAGRSMKEELKAARHFAWWMMGAGVAVLAVGLVGGWILVGGSLRPVEDMSIAASRIAEGNLAERISVVDTDSELGRLASVLNSTFSRLEAAFAQQRQFTADASHELRTPLAVIITEAQATLARDRSAAEYRETVMTCLEGAQQMKKLTQSLLQLARYDAGQERIERTAFDLAAQTQACVELIRPLAKDRNLSIRSELAPCQAFGDPDRLSQVFTNLLTNAIYYNQPGGDVLVKTGYEEGLAVVTVSDTGQGISPEALPHLFERFYREDQSRGRADGHHGLGLSICKAIVDAHGGRIEVSSQPKRGTTFKVLLPTQGEPAANGMTTN